MPANSAEEAIRGSDMIVAGRPDDSELLKRVLLPHTDEDVMPPKGKGKVSSCVGVTFGHFFVWPLVRVTVVFEMHASCSRTERQSSES